MLLLSLQLLTNNQVWYHQPHSLVWTKPYRRNQNIGTLVYQVSSLELSWLVFFPSGVFSDYISCTLSMMFGCIHIPIDFSESSSGIFSCTTSSLVTRLYFLLGSGAICRVPWLLKGWNPSRVLFGRIYSCLFFLETNSLTLDLGLQNPG